MWLSTRKQPTFYMLHTSDTCCCETTAWDLSSLQQGAAHSWQNSQPSWAHVSGGFAFLPEIRFVSPSAFDYFFYTLGSPTANPAAMCCLPLKVTAPLADGPWARTSLSSSHCAFHLRYEQSSKANQHWPVAMNGPLQLHGKMSWLKGPDLWTWWSFSPPHPQRSTYRAPSPVVAAGWLSVQLLQHAGLVVEDYQNAVLTRRAISLNTLAQLLLLHHFSSTF